MGYMYQQDPRFRSKPQVDLGKTFTDVIDGLKTGLKKLVKETKKITETVTAETSVTIEERYVNVCGLSISQSYADCIESFYRQSRVYEVDFRTLYDKAPAAMVEKVLCFLPAVPASDGSCEAILRRHIECAKDVNCSYVKAADCVLQYCIGWGGIQRTSLCVIWANLLFELFSRYTSTITSSERNRIARGGIAIAMGISIATIQYCHKSPCSITNSLRLLYEGYNNVRDWCNQHFPFKIPDVLRLESPRKEFAIMTDDEKTTVGQMLNMVYTFRVGDMFLEVCSKSSTRSLFTDDTIWGMIGTGLSPLPEQKEIEKLYKLYTSEKLYDL